MEQTVKDEGRTRKRVRLRRDSFFVWILGVEVRRTGGGGGGRMGKGVSVFDFLFEVKCRADSRLGVPSAEAKGISRWVRCLRNRYFWVCNLMRSSAHEEGQVLVLRNPKVAAVGVVTNVFPTAYADVSKVWDHNSLPVKVLSCNDGRDIPFPIIPTNAWRAFRTFQGIDRPLMSKGDRNFQASVCAHCSDRYRNFQPLLNLKSNQVLSALQRGHNSLDRPSQNY